MTSPRQWTAFAEETGIAANPFNHIYNWPQALEMSEVPRSKIVKINLIEDENGYLMGWLENDKGEEKVEMVLHKTIFSVQFAGGVDAEIEKGRGTPVTLRAEKVENLYP